MRTDKELTIIQKKLEKELSLSFSLLSKDFFTENIPVETKIFEVKNVLSKTKITLPKKYLEKSNIYRFVTTSSTELKERKKSQDYLRKIAPSLVELGEEFLTRGFSFYSKNTWISKLEFVNLIYSYYRGSLIAYPEDDFFDLFVSKLNSDYKSKIFFTGRITNLLGILEETKFKDLYKIDVESEQESLSSPEYSGSETPIKERVLHHSKSQDKTSFARILQLLPELKIDLDAIIKSYGFLFTNFNLQPYQTYEEIEEKEEKEEK